MVLSPNSTHSTGAARSVTTLFAFSAADFRGPECQPFAPMFEIQSYQKLYKWIIESKLHFRITLPLTPHSLRAGGATNLRLRGFSHNEIADIGRWEHVGTAKSYVDVVFNLLPETIAIENRCQPNSESAISDFLAAPF